MIRLEQDKLREKGFSRGRQVTGCIDVVRRSDVVRPHRATGASKRLAYKAALYRTTANTGGTSCITSWPTGAGGTVTSITAGPGLSGGTITTSGALSLNVGNANTWTNTQTFTTNTNFPGSGIWNNAGNVGIGTTTPGSALDVAGDINFSGTLRRGGNPLLSISGTTNGSSTGLGFGALQANAGGDFNSAFGNSSLKVNTTGSYNAAMGAQALQDNTTGSSNTSVGFNALQFNTVGANNMAIGASAMVDNTTGGSNTASGFSALANNSSGNNNTAFGADALVSNNTGSNNIAIGYYAAQNVSGASSNNIHIGTQGALADNGTIRIGGNTGLGDPAAQTSFFVAGVRGVTTGNTDAIPVVIDSAGQLGTVISSRRFKEDIQDMADASSGLMRLRPVTFRYQKPFADGSKPIQYGLIAEEVAEVYPDLVAHSADGQIETVKYQVLDSMLLNEVQRLNKENQALLERLSRLEAAMAKAAGGAGVQ